jgi:putative membrane protein
MSYAIYVNDAEVKMVVSYIPMKGRKTIMNNRKNILFGIGGSVVLLALAVLFFGHWGGYGRWAGNGSWWPMHHGYFGPGGMMGFGGTGIFFPIFWVLVVVAIVLLVAGIVSQKNQDKSATKDVADSLEILRQRYARGEIDQEEFLKKRDILREFNR